MRVIDDFIHRSAENSSSQCGVGVGSEHDEVGAQFFRNPQDDVAGLAEVYANVGG